MNATETTDRGKIQTSDRAPRWAWLIATFFGTGLLKPGPGTWASLATTLVWYGIGRQLPVSYQLPLNFGLLALTTAIGIPAATRISRELGIEDPGCVVIDETAGQLLAVLGSPLRWQSMLAGLILFRLFDITKPFPIRKLERFPEGIGVIVDDLGAGVYALVVMQLLLYFGILK